MSNRHFSSFSRIFYRQTKGQALSGSKLFAKVISRKQMTALAGKLLNKRIFLNFGKYSKILKNLLFLYSNKMLVFQGWNSQNACQISKQGRS